MSLRGKLNLSECLGYNIVIDSCSYRSRFVLLRTLSSLNLLQVERPDETKLEEDDRNSYDPLKRSEKDVSDEAAKCSGERPGYIVVIFYIHLGEIVVSTESRNVSSACMRNTELNRRKKSQGSNSGDDGNTEDRGKTVGGAIGARGSEIGEMVIEAKRSLDRSFEGSEKVFPDEAGK
ncbi:hypothetical protein Tco_0973884 [Tanacetum coccineum]|uniref:Uncharacterized protein n=1 Tax=Tanacetum coccineum TaxID=301880 RepID=A0ABQ5EAY4_9ASTR